MNTYKIFKIFNRASNLNRKDIKEILYNINRDITTREKNKNKEITCKICNGKNVIKDNNYETYYCQECGNIYGRPTQDGMFIPTSIKMENR